MASTYEVQTEDVEFARPDGEPLLARLYRPQGAGPFPGVVEVHGGAWTVNDRLTNEPIDRPLAESGVVVMAIDFRMPPVAQYPASISDINLAVRWLKAHAPQYKVEPKLVGGLGTSSGGHQVMLAAMRPHEPRYAALPLAPQVPCDASCAYLALCWPIVDPLARYRMAKAKGIQRLVDAHHAYWPDEAAMDEGSPQRILERGEACALPPALVIQGTADDNVTPDMADRFAAAYAEAGGALRLETFEGQPHSFVAKDPAAPAAVSAIEHIKAFIHTEARKVAERIGSAATAG